MAPKSEQTRQVGQRFRLYPTPEQEAQLGQAAGACRALYNAALEQRITAYRTCGVTLNSFSQNAGLTELLHAEGLEWVGEIVSRDSLKIALRDLDTAYTRFFKRQAGFPKFKRRGRGDSFKCSPKTYGFKKVNRRWAEIRIPKIGWVRFRLHAPIRGQMRSATFAREAVGWHVSLTMEIPGARPRTSSGSAVGLDRGVAATVVTSDGDFHHSPPARTGEARRRRALELRLARQVKGSNRRAKTVRQLASLRARQARRRKAFAHELTTSLVREHGVIVIEDLRVQNMTKSARGTVEDPGSNVRAKSGLNRVILEQGWGEIRRQLQYKTEWRGSALIEVLARHTSQLCSVCGDVAAENRKSQAVFVCCSCGHRDHADVNAARNILVRGVNGGTGARVVLAARGGLVVGRPANREGAASRGDRRATRRPSDRPRSVPTQESSKSRARVG